jgi:hypothetical protein
LIQFPPRPSIFLQGGDYDRLRVIATSLHSPTLIHFRPQLAVVCRVVWQEVLLGNHHRIFMGQQQPVVGRLAGRSLGEPLSIGYSPWPISSKSGAAGFRLRFRAQCPNPISLPESSVRYPSRSCHNMRLLQPPGQQPQRLQPGIAAHEATLSPWS